MSKADYLAKYTQGATAEKKEKKRKRQADQANLKILDGDELPFAVEKKKKRREEAPALVPQAPKPQPQSGGQWSGARAQSPPRKKGQDDQSPPRRKPAKDDDQSPPRRRPAKDDDQSPPRRRPAKDDDQSPPRKAAGTGFVKRERPGGKELDSPRKAGKDVDENGKPLMSTGVKSGFLTGDELNANIEEVKRRRKEMFANASKDETGEGAETIYRAKDGTQVDREEWLKSKEKKKRKERPEQKLEWGTGVAQRQHLEGIQDEAQKVAAEPMARYEIRQDVDEELRSKSHWDDPLQKMAMLEEKSRAVKTQSAPKRPQCRFPAPPNRFGIKPGYRWDGKVRGNDYEKRWFKAKGDRKHRVAEGYAWSTEDM